MRVLADDSSPGTGGALTSIASLERVLVRRGHELHVLARAEKAARAQGLSAVYAWPHTEWRRHTPTYPVRIVQHARVLSQLVVALQPDVILANNSPSTNAAAVLVARAFGIPLVQYVRAKIDDGRWTQSLLTMADAVLVVGDDAAESTARASLRCTRVDEGLDGSAWPSPRSASASHWLWCSALLAWKGIDLFVEASRKAGLTDVDICAAEMPLGTEGAVPASRVTELTRDARYSLHLDPTPRALDHIRANCHSYVHTALQPEPFGRSILEAMAAGLCPVVPDEGGGRRLVHHNETGLHYPARSVDGLVLALRTLAREPARREALAAAAKSSALAFTASAVFAPIVAMLEQTRPSRSVSSTALSRALSAVARRVDLL